MYSTLNAAYPEYSCDGPGFQRLQGRTVDFSWYHVPKSLLVPGYKLNKAIFHCDNLVLNWQKNLGHITSYENTDCLENHKFILVAGIK